MKSWARVVLGVLGTCLFLFLVFWGAFWFTFAPENWSRRKARFEKAGSAGMALVGAIRRYSADHGAPPPNLEALVPRYLLRIPSTGLRDYPAFSYRVFTNSRSSLVWYDLGARERKPMAGLWVYAEGKPEHAILALILDQNDRIVGARVDRMPHEHERMDFDRDKWLRQESRIEMVRSLPEHVPLKGATLSEVQLTLGEPTGIRTLRDAPWELRIECSNGMLNWDVFFYWPSENYPEHVYGGSTEMIGKWAYVHE